MNVLLMLCESLIQKTKYEKYLNFVSGFLMMMCLVKPLIDLSGASGYLDAAYIQNQIKNEWKIISSFGDLKEMKDEVREEYDRAVEKQVTEIGAAFSIEVAEVKIRWQADESSMEKLNITGRAVEEQEETLQIRPFREALMEYYDLESSDIEIEVGD